MSLSSRHNRELSHPQRRVFFSVQTISTIGYGNMHPLTKYGNIVMTIEAGMELLIVAMITGLMFAKASRAKASVIFSQNLIVGTRFGVSTLQCRVGNAKGNDVVEARFGLSVLIDEVTPEGEKVRRIHDLKLKRGQSPFFMMTMVMMHEIDDSSPLWRIDWTQADSPIEALVATVSGHEPPTVSRCTLGIFISTPISSPTKNLQTSSTPTPMAD